MNLSAHFTLAELIASDTAIRKGIDNTPPADVLARLGVLAEGLERVRAVLAVPMHINSGYRCPALNRAIGSAPGSAHVKGDAADFVAPDFGNPRAVAKAIAESGIAFDQLIQEGAWVHISFAPAMRREVLTAEFTNGLATYSRGLA